MVARGAGRGRPLFSRSAPALTEEVHHVGFLESRRALPRTGGGMSAPRDNRLVNRNSKSLSAHGRALQLAGGLRGGGHTGPPRLVLMRQKSFRGATAHRQQPMGGGAPESSHACHVRLEHFTIKLSECLFTSPRRGEVKAT